jgi:hypothetical protein
MSKKMQIIDDVLKQIEENRFSGSSALLAQALASACSKHYNVSLLDASTKLDRTSMKMFYRLASITKEPDFSNADQEAAIRKLKELEFI